MALQVQQDRTQVEVTDMDDVKAHGVSNGLSTLRMRKQVVRFGILLTLLCILYWRIYTKDGSPWVFITQHVASEVEPVKNTWEKITTRRRADWAGEEDTPDFCKRIFENPKPLHNKCQRNAKNLTCMNFGETQMFSQFHQDYYLYTRHFHHLKRPGVYVDIAANDPIMISNTYFFDRCLGWKGVCVEGNPEYYEKLYRLRSCHLVPTCVGSSDGEMVSFALNGGGGGVMSESYKLRKRVERDNITMITERCTTMKLALERESVTEVDYLSLDVEGHELQVLNGFDLDVVIIKVMTIEVTGTALKDIEKILIPKGYKRHIPDLDGLKSAPGLLREDAIFLHNSVTFGSPV